MGGRWLNGRFQYLIPPGARIVPIISSVVPTLRDIKEEVGLEHGIVIEHLRRSSQDRRPAEVKNLNAIDEPGVC